MVLPLCGWQLARVTRCVSGRGQLWQATAAAVREQAGEPRSDLGEAAEDRPGHPQQVSGEDVNGWICLMGAK